jgi:outer membrane murein-binding lipoprotein Lpp
MKTFSMKTLFAVMALSSFLLIGCSSQMTGDNMIQDEIDKRDAQIAELKGELEKTEANASRTAHDLENSQARNEDAERQIELLNARMQDEMGSGEAELLPPSASPGECFARVVVEPVYETRTERVLIKEASETIEIVPATYEWVENRVLIKEASERIETVPATFEWVEEQMLVKPATTVMNDVPATFETVNEQILVTPARTFWKKGRGLVERVDNNTGEIMCLVEEPAVYRNVSKRVLKTPATTKETTIDAEYETVRRQVVKTPATTRTIEIPAEYGTVKVRQLVRAESEKRTPVPAEYAEITKREMVTPSHMEWRQVLCETNITNAVVANVQQALADKGHSPGPIDGIYGTRTLNAVKAFQTAQNMPVGGLTYETLKALGVHAKK